MPVSAFAAVAVMVLVVMHVPCMTAVAWSDVSAPHGVRMPVRRASRIADLCNCAMCDSVAV